MYSDKGMKAFAKQHKATIALALEDNVYDRNQTSEDNSISFTTFFDNANETSGAVAENHKNDGEHFPSMYYDFQVDGGRGKRVHFIFLDTDLLDVLPGKELGDSDQAIEIKSYEQWNWIESTLAQSKADFLIVAGQYAALDQRTEGLAEKLVPLLQKYDVTAYLNGT